MKFNRTWVKNANERLRKLEKVYKNRAGEALAESSPEYQLIKHYALDLPNGRGSIFDVKYADAKQTRVVSIRFKNATGFKNLDEKQQQFFIESLDKFLNAQTTTKLGIEKAQQDAYQKFMKNHKNLKGLTFNEYQDFFVDFDNEMKRREEDRNDHYGYSEKPKEGGHSIKDRLDLILNNATAEDIRNRKDNKMFSYIVDDMKTPQISRMRRRNNNG